MLFCRLAELALKARREIADYISAGKEDRARIRVKHLSFYQFVILMCIRMGEF